MGRRSVSRTAFRGLRCARFCARFPYRKGNPSRFRARLPVRGFARDSARKAIACSRWHFCLSCASFARVLREVCANFSAKTVRAKGGGLREHFPSVLGDVTHQLFA